MADLTVAVALVGEDRLSGPARAASASLKQVESAASGADAAVAGFGQTVARVAAGGAALAGMVGFAQAIQAGFRAAGEAAVGFNARLEQTTVGFATLLKSGEDAEAMLFDLQQLAAQTPFSFEDVAVGARNLLAMGFAARDVRGILVDLGNVAAGLGQSSEGFAAMARVLGQMQATGRVLAGDLLQLSQAGFPVARVFEVMAEQTGKTIDELRKMQQEGVLSVDTFIAAFRRIAQVDFAGAMERQSRTFSGAMSTIRDSLLQVGAFAFKPLFDRLSDLAQRIARFVSSDDFMRWASSIAAAVDVALDGIRTLAEGFATGLGAVLDIVVDLGRAIYEALMWLNPFATHSPSLVDQVDDGVKAINRSFGDLSQATPPIDTAAMSLDQLKKALEGAKEESKVYADAVKDAERAIQDLSRSALQGEGAFSDRAFALDQQINRVQLQLTRAQLRGAPKDQIKALEDSLRRLRLEADQVRLEERLKFDPLHHEIDKLANPRTERSFQDVVAGIKAQQEALTQLRPAAEAAAAREKQLADAVKAASDAAKDAKAAGLGGLAVGPRGDPLAGLKQTLDEAKGKLAAFKTDFENAKKDWADLGPIRRAFDDAFGPGTFDKIIDALKDVSGWILTIGETAKKTFPRTTAAFADFSDQLDKLIVALAGADTALGGFNITMENDIVLIGRIADAFGELLGRIGFVVAFVGEGLVKAFKDAGVAINGIGDGLSWLARQFESAIASMDGAMHRFSQGLVDALGTLGADLSAKIRTEFGKIRVDAGPFHLSTAGFTIDAPTLPPIRTPFESPAAPRPAAPTIPGFQHGGVFRVGGSGGPDSQMVAFRATPGEVVAVGHGRGGGGPVVNVSVNVGEVRSRADADYLADVLPAALARALEKARSQQGMPQATGLVRYA